MSMIVFDIDTQERFMRPKGEDFIEGADLVIPSINKVVENALRYEKLIVSTTYGPEMGFGLDKISDTVLVDDEFYYNVANINHGIDMNVAEACWHINFEKEHEDIWNPELGQPDNLETFLRTEGVVTVIMVGCNFRGAISDAISGLIQSKYHVRLITDAVVGIDLDDIDESVEQLTTEQLVQEFKETYNA